MNCKQIETWLTTHLLKELPPRMKNHIDDCPACQQRLQRIAEFEDILSGLSRVNVPEANSLHIWPRVAIGLSRERDRRKARTRFLAVGVPALASACVVALLIYAGQILSPRETQRVQIIDARLDGKPATLSVVDSPQSGHDPGLAGLTHRNGELWVCGRIVRP